MSEIKTETLDVEERLAADIKAETPDIFDDLMNEIPQKKHSPAFFTVMRDIVKKPQIYAVLAAVVVLFVGAGAVVSQQNKTFAVIGLDVNPSIEISINQKSRVVSAEALNEDGEKVLHGMDLKGSDINTACNALIGVMALEGYLTEESNSMLVSVQSEDMEKGKKLEADLSEKLSRFVENSEIAAVVMGQFVEDDERVAELAEEYGISTGKAWLILRLLDTGSRHFTADSLSRLTTQELILLGQNRNAFKEKQHGEVSTSKYISEKKAVKAVLKHAGISRNDVSGIGCEFDCDDGKIIYEVDIHFGGREYEYEVDAVTGKVLMAEIENGDKEWDGILKSGDDDHDDDDDDHDDDHDEHDDDDDHDDHDDDHDDHDDDHDDEDDD